MSAELVAFLHGQLNAEERGALEAKDGRSGQWFVGGKWNVYCAEDETPHDDVETNELVVYGNGAALSAHIARHDPARVLAEIEAKRRTLVRCEEALLSASPMLVHFAKQTLREMALPYPDRPEWAPDA